MADLTTNAVTPSVISYTPLDLSRVQARLGSKVQEVEGAAAAGRNLISALDFKDGYMLAGQAKDLQNEYSGKIQNLVEGLYNTGDTRSFTADLSLLSNQINTDERILAGQKDFELSKVHDQYGIDPTKRGFYYKYTSDNSPTGNIAAADWKNKEITRDDVNSFFQIFPEEDLFGDYNTQLEGLNQLKLEEFMGMDQNGFLVFKSTQGPSELPQTIRDIVASGGSQAEAVAAHLKSINPGLYQQLASDYDKGGTDSAINYRDGRGIGKEQFIGEVILENAPYLEDVSYDLQTPSGTGSGGGGSDIKPPAVTPVQTETLATVLDQGVASELLEAGDLSIKELSSVLGFGAEAKGTTDFMTILADPEANRQDIANAGYFVSIINDWNTNGDPTYSNVFTNGNELKAAADEATLELLNTAWMATDRTLSPQSNPETFSDGTFDGLPPTAAFEGAQKSFITVYGDIIGDQDPVEFFHKIRNTRNLLGQFDASGFNLENKDELISAYDGYLQNPSLANQLTFGVGFLSPDEFAAVLNRQEEESYTVNTHDPLGFMRGGNYEGYSNLGEALNRYEKASNYFLGGIRPAGAITEELQLYDKINRNAPFLNREAQMSELRETSPIAFYEAARIDIMNRSQLYHTDVILQPGSLQRSEGIIEEGTKQFSESLAPSIVDGEIGADFGANWTISKFLKTPTGGATGLKDAGVESPRVSIIKGDAVLESPYEEMDLTNRGTKNLLQNFINSSSSNTDVNKGAGDFIFQGLIVPNGQTSEVGLVFSHRQANGGVESYIFTPKNQTALENNPLVQSMDLTQKTLAGKQYLPQVMTGDAYLGMYGEQINNMLSENVDLYGVTAEYVWSDTKANLSNTELFNPLETFRDTDVPNPYFDGNTSVVADIAGGSEVYRFRRKDGTGDVRWSEYLEGFAENPDLASTYLGVSDYEGFLVSVLLNKEQINDAGGNVTDEAIMGLLQSTTMPNLKGISEALGTEWGLLTNIPITFNDTSEAFHHFAGQSSRGPDRAGNPRSGYFISTNP